MTSTTLTSLAMLKVHIDQQQDYLDYLRPFILQVLVDHKPDPVAAVVVRDHIRTDYGLEIPDRAVQLMLKRLSRQVPLKKEAGVYRIRGTLPNPGIIAEKSSADRHIQAVIKGLNEFSESKARPLETDDQAVSALLAFLSRFNIPCLKAYLRGTAIPPIKSKNVQIVLVSEYILYLQRTDPERFESFMILLQGHMLANALMCPDLQHAPKTYKGVTFYLDTPLLIQKLGLEGEPNRAATANLIELVRNLGASVAAFSHSRLELQRVITGVADHVGTSTGRGAIVMEARRSGLTKSDFLLLVGQIDDKLRAAKIEVRQTPKYIEGFQIDEKVFEQVLQDEVSYYNPRAREDDINSVRSIYVSREGAAPSTVEKSRAVLVTNNSAFARAAFDYGQRHEESREVSTVITDFGLANMAWLKAPLGAPSLPVTEVLAFAYAALRPSTELLSKYLTEIECLERQGKITERDHQLLRSSWLAHNEMMSLTLGDENALTAETITETLERVTSQIKKEESERLSAERIAHSQTLDELAKLQADRERVQKQLYWRYDQRAKLWSWTIAVCMTILLLGGMAAGLGLKSKAPILGWIFLVGLGFVTLATFLNLIFGFSVREMRRKLEKRLLTWFLRREAAATGLDLGNAE